MACFHFLSDNASDTEDGVVMLLKFVRKVLWVVENILTDRKFDKG